MYAIIETGGKQLRVASGDKVKVEKLAADAGAEIILDKVLTINGEDKNIIGTPYVSGASVKAEVIGTAKGDKVIVHKQRPRRVYRKTNGHRQLYTTLKIKEIVVGG